MNADAALRTRIDAARLRTLAWLDSMQAPGEPVGVARISAAHDPARWPGMLLPGTYNAVLCRQLLGALPDERTPLLHWLLRFRRADGIFRIPGMRAEDVFKKPDADETWRYIDWHVSNYSLGAVQALASGAVPPPDFIRPYLDPITLKAWLADRDLRDPWQEGNNIVNLASFLLLLGRQAQVDRALDILFRWHDYH
ncbi:MAG: hypothetical protein ACHQIO_07860, partial [Nevskiales bacterium]